MQVTDTPILRRMLRPLMDTMREDQLQAVISIKPDPGAVARYQELATRNTEGELTPEERRELEAMVSANMMLSIFSKVARVTLASRAA